jgi:hypothetical protein
VRHWPAHINESQGAQQNISAAAAARNPAGATDPAKAGASLRVSFWSLRKENFFAFASLACYSSLVPG